MLTGIGFLQLAMKPPASFAAFAIASGRGLNHRLGTIGEAERSHVARGMSAQIAHRIDYRKPHRCARQPRIQGARHAVLADDQAHDRPVGCFLEQLHGAQIVDASHLPLSKAARRTDRGHGRNQRVRVEFIDAHEFRSADRCRDVAERATVIGETAAAAAVHRSALDGEVDILG
jgi:hypothetical protein